MHLKKLVCFTGLALALHVSPSALAQEASPKPIIADGSYTLRKVAQGWNGTQKPAPPQLCDIVTTMTIQLQGDTFVAHLTDRYAGLCGDAVLPTNERQYSFKQISNAPCGIGYEALQAGTDAASGTCIGGHCPTAFLNDYRNAPPSCLEAAQTPTVFPILTLQETASDVTRWTSW